MTNRIIHKILPIILQTVLVIPVLSPAAVHAASGTYSIQAIGTFETEACRRMLEDINDLRLNDAWYWDPSNTEKITVSGLTPLVYDYGLEQAAMQRAAELAVFYDHARPDGESCFTAFGEEYQYGAVGENIAYGYTNADAVFEGWEQEYEDYAGQEHRRNMLNPDFKAVGVGCFECDGILFWAQEFSSVSSEAAPSPLVSPVSMNVSSDQITEVSFGSNLIKTEPGQTVDLSAPGPVVKTRQGTLVPCTFSDGDFEIEDPAIANIMNGKLTALQKGETTLSLNKCGYSLPVRIAVTEKDTLIPDIPTDVTVTDGKMQYLRFIPEETGYYTFCSEGEYDTTGHLYDADKKELASNDDGPMSYNFSFSFDLTENTLYYLGVSLYGDGEGSFPVTVKKTEKKDELTDGPSYDILSDGTGSIS